MQGAFEDQFNSLGLFQSIIVCHLGCHRFKNPFNDRLIIHQILSKQVIGFKRLHLFHKGQQVHKY